MTKAVKPAAQAAATVVAQAAGKKPVPAAKATLAKAPAPAKKAAGKKAPAKKTAAVKNVPAKKAVAKKAAPAKPPAPKAHAQAKPAVPALTAEAQVFARVKKAVLKMGSERPTKTKSFLRHIGALLGQGSTAEQIDALVARLEKAGVVRVKEHLVSYG